MGSFKFLHHWFLRKIPPFRFLQLSATYADLMRQARIDEHKSQLARDRNVTLWELHLPLRDPGILNTKLIPKIIQTAHSSFLNQLLEIESKL